MRMLGFRKLCFLGSGFLLTLLCGLQAAFGQTSADLSTKYRQVVSYLLRPTVIMTPRFAVDGQVCEMAIERRQNTDTEIVIATSFSEEEVHELVDELAPEAERGRNLTRHLNGFVAGGSIITQYSYENLLVQVYGTTRPEHFSNVLCCCVAPRALERVGEEHIQGQGRSERDERPCCGADDDCFFKSLVAHGASWCRD